MDKIVELLKISLPDNEPFDAQKVIHRLRFFSGKRTLIIYISGTDDTILKRLL